MVEQIRKLMKREQELRVELRAVSEKLSAIRAALGMPTPVDYTDAENPDPYVTIRSLVVGAVNAAGHPVSPREVARTLRPVRVLKNEQVAMALYNAAQLGLVRRLSRAAYAPLEATSPTEPTSADYAHAVA